MQLTAICKLTYTPENKIGIIAFCSQHPLFVSVRGTFITAEMIMYNCVFVLRPCCVLWSLM